MVVVHSEQFNDNAGLDLHVRTTIDNSGRYSFIKAGRAATSAILPPDPTLFAIIVQTSNRAKLSEITVKTKKIVGLNI